MTEKEFLNRIAGNNTDILQQFIDLLRKMEVPYCVIGGLAVNAYVEPVVSLDIDIVIAVHSVKKLNEKIETFATLKKFTHSINIVFPGSDLRIQIQTDSRYQSFIDRAAIKNVLGYQMNVAAVEDVLKGKIWAYSDTQRRNSKRQKDLADIFRIVEAYSDLITSLPDSIKQMFT